MDFRYVFYLLIAVSIGLTQLNQRLASPVLAIFNRWMRMAVFAIGIAVVCRSLEWSDLDYASLALVGALLWILGETIYNWLVVGAMSASALPLFPHFTLNQGGDEWPTNPRLLRMRDWLRARGFKQVQALKAEVVPGHYLRVSIYQDEQATTRLQLTFFPQAGGSIIACASFASHTSAGRRYITDNLFLPFGGFYPDDWSVLRKPWCRSPQRLLREHRERLSRSGEIALPWATEPLADINQQQKTLEQVNTELGFLQAPSLREEHGKITYEGRYRVWKEVFTLGYLGRSTHYE